MADNQNENNNYEQIIEAILFAAGRVVAEQELMIALEMSQEKIENIINKMQIRYEKSGIQIIKVEKGYYYRLRGYHSCTKSGVTENGGSSTNGIYIG